MVLLLGFLDGFLCVLFDVVEAGFGDGFGSFDGFDAAGDVLEALLGEGFDLVEAQLAFVELGSEPGDLGSECCRLRLRRGGGRRWFGLWVRRGWFAGGEACGEEVCT